MMNDPFLNGVRALKDALSKGLITEAQYHEMYEAIARAAEQDSLACSVEGCLRAAYIGTKCAHHTTKADVIAAVREVRHG